MPSLVEITSLQTMQMDFAFGFLCGFSLIAWIVSIVWVYKDAEDRGMDSAMWALMTFLFGWITIMIYLVVRPRKVPAWLRPNRPVYYDTPVGYPSPGPHLTPPVRYVRPKPKFCPHCGRRLIEKTLKCPLCEM